MKKFTVRDLVILASFAAAAVVLRLFTIYIVNENSRIVFYNIPIMLASFAYGPIAGMLTGIIADVSSLPYQAGWDYLYLIPSAMWGLIPGLLKNVFPYRKIGFLFLIEIITHLFVSATNTLILWYRWGYNAAFGTVDVETFKFGIVFIEEAIKFFEVDGMIYTRLFLVFGVMIVKIPIDCLILNIINKRVIDPLVLKMNKTTQNEI